MIADGCKRWAWLVGGGRAVSAVTQHEDRAGDVGMAVFVSGDGGELVATARAAQPGLIVVDRAVPGVHQNYLARSTANWAHAGWRPRRSNAR